MTTRKHVPSMFAAIAAKTQHFIRSPGGALIRARLVEIKSIPAPARLFRTAARRSKRGCMRSAFPSRWGTA